MYHATFGCCNFMIEHNSNIPERLPLFPGQSRFSCLYFLFTGGLHSLVYSQISNQQTALLSSTDGIYALV
jgi:hypothetical protein